MKKQKRIEHVFLHGAMLTIGGGGYLLFGPTGVVVAGLTLILLTFFHSFDTDQ